MICINGVSECTGCMLCQEEERSIGKCINGHEIYAGDKYYNILGNIYCEDCIEDCAMWAESEDI